jgi:hypothetical protein
MLQGFTIPYSPSGRSAIIPPPPWHYAGQLLSLSFDVDHVAAQSLLPDVFASATGGAAAHFCEWQSTSDGTELLDPIYAQYREFILLIEFERAGRMGFYCPFIYVDQDLAMVRGWLQGWPKKAGSIWMTRNYDFDHPAAAPLRPGTRMGASLAVKDRRLAEAAIELTAGIPQPIGFLAGPTYGLIASPTIVGTPQSGTPLLARAVVATRVSGPSFAGAGSLRLFDSPHDEVAMLKPTAMKGASISTLALTVTGAVVE